MNDRTTDGNEQGFAGEFLRIPMTEEEQNEELLNTMDAKQLLHFRLK